MTRHADDKEGEWTGFRGRITAEMIKESGMPEPSDDTLICMCGPMAFCKTVTDTLTSLGYSGEMIHKF